MEERAKSGTAHGRDESATRILRESARPLERLVASYARSDADRADLRQDVALALWSALPSFRGDCSERTFLLRIAHNRALTFIARRGLPTDEVEDHADRVVATSGKNPAIAYERKQRESRLLAAVRALPVLHRQVITLMLEGLSHREIASVLGTTENNVGVRANRARAAVRVLLEDTEAEAKEGASS
jgi:RNA polymerase sigma-70 factor (ECF subfamily)